MIVKGKNTFKEYWVTDFNQLHLYIFTIGYNGEGESILAVIKEGERCLYTFLVDCYKGVDDYNHASEILHKEGIPNIDAIIWTHPDEDHSVGFKEFIDEFDTKHQAEVFIPLMSSRNEGLCEESRRNLEYIENYYNSGKKRNLISLIVNNKADVYDQLSFKERQSSRIMNCRFKFYLPNGSMVQRRLDKEIDKWNNLSILFSLECNGYTYLFGGDITEQSLQFVPFDQFSNVCFVKIPHHGSAELKSFSQRIRKGCMNGKVLATVTEFSGKNLPKKDVLDQYMGFCKGIYCTGQGAHLYGCVETNFNLSNLNAQRQLTGNALIYSEKL